MIGWMLIIILAWAIIDVVICYVWKRMKDREYGRRP